MLQTSLLYSYRRCPYAMRARMALVCAGIQCDVHEIALRDKPPHMLEISPKGTVPVLQAPNGQVIEESLDIMHWALAQRDPEDWLVAQSSDRDEVITRNDGEFKAALDRYKYPDRFPDENCSNAVDIVLSVLRDLNDVLQCHPYLHGERVSVTDIAVFPFIRQCANVDRAWFYAQNLPALQRWLAEHLDSELFKMIFKKQKDSQYKLLPP